MHRRQNDGILCLSMQTNRSEKGFKMHRSLQIYIERRYGKDLQKRGLLYREINIGVDIVGNFNSIDYTILTIHVYNVLY